MLTKLILGALISVFALRELWSLLRHGRGGTITATVVKISKRWPVVPLAAGIAIGWLLSASRAPQRFVRLFENVVEHVAPPNAALAIGIRSERVEAEAPGATGSPSEPVEAEAPVKASFQVIASHPRFWGTEAELEELKAKAATREGQAIVKNTLARAKAGPDKSGDRLLCAAFIHRFGSSLGVDAATCEALGAQAVEDLLAATPRQGVQADVGWGGAQWALAYDWLHSLLTEAQKQKLIETATAALEDRNERDGSTWRGYNQLSGDIPMALALATYNETAKEYVADVYQNNWFRARPPFWNYGWQKRAWAAGGSREGFAQYFASCYPNFATRALWESATSGDRSLETGYFGNVPYWHAFQCLPDSIGPAGKWPMMLYTCTFSGGNGSGRGLWSILQSATRFSDERGKQLARWLIDQCQGWNGVNRTPGDALLFGLLIGDPRIKGVDPGKLGVPLQFVMDQPGEYFARSDWTGQANLVWFGNHTTGARVTPAGEFALYSKGAYLFGNAAHRIAHSYAWRWLQCGVCFVTANGTPAFANANVGSVPDYLPRGTFPVVTEAGGSKVTVSAECARNFGPLKGGAPLSLIQRCDRTFTCDAAVKTITLVDDVACDKSIAAHVVFPCPTEPVVSAENGRLSVAIKNGTAACTLTFTLDDGQLTTDDILAIGGPKNYADGLPGTAGAAKPHLFPGTELDKDFAKLAVSNPAAALKQMGFWRFHVVLPAGGGKLTTTIAVH